MKIINDTPTTTPCRPGLFWLCVDNIAAVLRSGETNSLRIGNYLGKKLIISMRLVKQHGNINMLFKSWRSRRNSVITNRSCRPARAGAASAGAGPGCAPTLWTHVRRSGTLIHEVIWTVRWCPTILIYSARANWELERDAGLCASRALLFFLTRSLYATGAHLSMRRVRRGKERRSVAPRPSASWNSTNYTKPH